jgi:hypothetical protein
MKRVFPLVFFTLLALLPAVSGSCAELDIPGVDQCEVISIIRSEGPQLTVHRDGSATLVFGALEPHATTKPGVFNFRKVYSRLRPRMVENRTRSDESSVAVGFYRWGESGTRLFFVDDEKLVAELFATAERHSFPLAPFGK